MAAQLSALSDTELLQRFWVERDPLTTTDLDSDYDAKSGGVAMKRSEDFPKARELLDVLTDFDIDEAKPLRDQLDRLKKFDQAMEDLLEPLQTLTTLATTE